MQASKRSMQELTRHESWESRSGQGDTSDQPFPSCRGIGDGMQAKGTRRNTGSPSGDCRMDQPESRERQAGPFGVSGRLIVPKKPGNAGGGKESQLEVNARSDEDGGIGL